MAAIDRYAGNTPTRQVFKVCLQEGTRNLNRSWKSGWVN